MGILNGNHTYIVDLFDDLAGETARLSGINLHFEYGHPMEIVEQIQKMRAKPSLRRFPLLALLMDFDETKGERPDIQSTVSLNLIIATLTKPESTARQRYAETFKPKLYPIYEGLIDAIKRSGYFLIVNELIPHTKTDHVMWGKAGLYGNTEKTFNDFIDAIEINNLKLQIKNNICYGNNSK